MHISVTRRPCANCELPNSGSESEAPPGYAQSNSKPTQLDHLARSLGLAEDIASVRHPGELVDTPVVGLDLGKRVFQVHVASPDAPPIKRKLNRDELIPFLAAVPRGVVAMEAAGAAHYWSREIEALGHETKLIPPKYVTPFRKGNKNDAKDAEAICEAAQRPHMRFAIRRSPDHQSILLLHTLRRHAIAMRVANSNALNGMLHELGLVADSTEDLLERAATLLSDTSESAVPLRLRRALRSLVTAISEDAKEEREIDAEIEDWAHHDRTTKLLQTIPGVGPQSATVAAATMGDPSNFESGSQFAAFVGVAPTHWGTGGRIGIRQIPDRAGYLRSLLYQGASTVITTQKKKKFVDNPWLGEMVGRKARKVACIAQANKTARMIWAIAKSGLPYQKPAARPLQSAKERAFVLAQTDTWVSDGGRVNEVE